MAQDANKVKSDFLGMSFSTADYRLKKSIMFSLLEKHEENVCYRCGLKIETPEELTVEHKSPWLHIDPDLFWDLENIAFSHFKCNAGVTRSDTEAVVAHRLSTRKTGKSGTVWCITHQDFLPEENFKKNSTRWNGFQRQCQECRLKNPSRIPKKLALLAQQAEPGIRTPETGVQVVEGAPRFSSIDADALPR